MDYCSVPSHPAMEMENRKLEAENAKLRDFGTSIGTDLRDARLQIEEMKRRPDTGHWSSTALALKAAQKELEAANRLNGRYQKALEWVATLDDRAEPITWHEALAKCVEVAKEALADKPECEHQWVDARNEIVKSGELCLRCHAIRAGNATTNLKRLCGQPIIQTGTDCPNKMPCDRHKPCSVCGRPTGGCCTVTVD